MDGKIIEAGNLKVFLPDGYNMTTGSNTGDPDDNQVWFHVTPPTFFNYYWIIRNDNVTQIDSNISLSKKMNNGEDVAPFELNGTNWSGMTYMYGDVVCNTLKGDAKDTHYQVTVIGHEIASEEVQTVLSSICLK